MGFQSEGVDQTTQVLPYSKRGCMGGISFGGLAVFASISTIKL